MDNYFTMYIAHCHTNNWQWAYFFVDKTKNICNVRVRTGVIIYISHMRCGTFAN